MYLAIDVGGTKTLLALFSKSGRMVKKLKFPTDHDPAGFSRDLKNSLKKFFPRRKLAAYIPVVNAVTVAIAASVDENFNIEETHLNGRPLVYGNLPWSDFNFSGAVSSCIKYLFSARRIRSPHLTGSTLPYTPVFIRNDADLATVFEAGGMKGRVIYLTYSTGIGAGIWDDGRLDPRSGGFEPGHKKYIFESKRLEYEDIASAEALRAAYGQIATDIKGPENFKDIALRMSIGLSDIIRSECPDVVIIGGALGLRLRYYKKYLIGFLSASLDRNSLPEIAAAKTPLESVVHGCYLYGRSKN